jgi:hypothetical protein
LTLLAVGVVFAAFARSGPGVNCTTQAVSGLGVAVVDEHGNAVCDATVTATDGPYSEVLMTTFGGCAYSGAVERKGTYAITARLGARSVQRVGVRVTGDECHVRPTHVTLTLPA